VNYKNGRKILELAAESGLSAIAAGLESTPMPGSAVYGEYLEEGRIHTERAWSDYGGGGEHVVFQHPLMPESEMLDTNSEVMKRAYSMGRIVKRTLHAVTHGCSRDVAKTAFFMQLGLRKAYHQLHVEIQARS
jgi:hypothetical protein